MRDAHDQATAELPTLPPPATRRARSEPPPNAHMRKLACGYTTPREVESCRNCKHLEERLHHTGSVGFEGATLYCRRNRFSVKFGAICDDWISKPGAALAESRKR